MVKPNCKRHPKTIENYNGTIKELANDIGNLHYEKMAELLHSLAYKIGFDADKDMNAGRKELALVLSNASVDSRRLAEKIDRAWVICKPYMNNDS